MKYNIILIIFILIFSCKPRLSQIDESVLNDYDGYDTIWTDSAGNSLIGLGMDDGAFGSHYDYAYHKSGKLYLIKPGYKSFLYSNDMIWDGDSILYFYDNEPGRIFGPHWISVDSGIYWAYYDPQRIESDENKLIYQNGRLISIGTHKVDLDSAYLKSLNGSIYKLSGNRLELYKSLDFDLSEFTDGIYYFSYPGMKINDKIELNEIKSSG